MQKAGICASSAREPLDGHLQPGLFLYVAPFGLLRAAALILRLLVFGVNERRWKEAHGAAEHN
jgi:hypothetical protein